VGVVVHQAPAQQLRGPLPAAFGCVPLTLEPTCCHPVALHLAPAELATTTRAVLAAVGLDPDATGWPPL
jgi:hypothetical protein